MPENTLIGEKPACLARGLHAPMPSRTRRGQSWLLSSPTRDWLDSRAGKFFRVCVHLALLGMVGAASVSLVVPLLSHSRIPAQAAVTDPPVTHPDSVEQIVAAHLFGQAPSGIPARPANTAPTDIALTGIVYAAVAAHSRAMLSVHGRAVVAAVGDTLADGTKVAAIESRRVVLNQAGKPVLLVLDFIAGNTGNTLPGFSADARRRIADSPNPPAALDYSGDAAGIASTSILRPARIPASASPLEQLHALRSQLIRGQAPRYLPSHAGSARSAIHESKAAASSEKP